jgi:tetratricopeptide (TPR) repeat protein
LGNILFYKRGNLVHPILFTYDNQKKEFVYQTMFRWERKEFDKRKNTAEYRKVCEEWYSNILAQTSNKYGGAGNIDLQYTYIKRIEEVSPISAYAYDVMAWFYMSPSNSTYRDVKKAAQFAEKSVSLQRHWGNVHTLACAYAESGDFEKAVQLTEEAVNKCDEEDAKKELNESLGWFKEKKTFTQMKYGKTEKEEKK